MGFIFDNDDDRSQTRNYEVNIRKLKGAIHSNVKLQTQEREEKENQNSDQRMGKYLCWIGGQSFQSNKVMSTGYEIYLGQGTYVILILV
jgi:hypothetical protein